MKHVRTRQLDIPAGLDIAWIERVATRYVTTLVLEDRT